MFKRIKKRIFKDVQEEITSLEGRLFKKKDSSYGWSGMMNWYMGGYSAISLEEEIDILQEELEALTNYLKVEIKHEETDKYIVRKVRKKK